MSKKPIGTLMLGCMYKCHAQAGNEQGLYSVLRMSVKTAAVLTRLKKCWSAERESQVRSPGPEPILMVLK